MAGQIPAGHPPLAGACRLLGVSYGFTATELGAILPASLIPHSRARAVSCGSSRSCFVTRKLSGSAITSKPCARSSRSTPVEARPVRVRSGLEVVRRARSADMAGLAADGRAAVDVVRRTWDRRDTRLTAGMAARDLVLTRYDLDCYVYAARKAGAAGFLAQSRTT